jgi:hypothetical protein
MVRFQRHHQILQRDYLSTAASNSLRTDSRPVFASYRATGTKTNCDYPFAIEHSHSVCLTIAIIAFSGFLSFSPSINNPRSGSLPPDEPPPNGTVDSMDPRIHCCSRRYSSNCHCSLDGWYPRTGSPVGVDFGLEGVPTDGSLTLVLAGGAGVNRSRRSNSRRMEIRFTLLMLLTISPNSQTTRLPDACPLQ